MTRHVTLHVWRVPHRRLLAALWHTARDPRRLRASDGVSFAKVLGTGPGFAPGSVDLSRWAVLVCWRSAQDAADFDATAIARAWRRLATGHCRLDLAPIASRGTWAGQTPFTPPGAGPADGTVVAITRARLRPARALRFWRAIRPVAGDVQGAAGLLAAFGIGEAPIGWQGTVSVWRDAADLRRFAYEGAAHAEVVARTPQERWYAEELFARFALLRVEGDPGVLGWTG